MLYSRRRSLRRSVGGRAPLYATQHVGAVNPPHPWCVLWSGRSGVLRDASLVTRASHRVVQPMVRRPGATVPSESMGGAQQYWRRHRPVSPPPVYRDAVLSSFCSATVVPLVLLSVGLVQKGTHVLRPHGPGRHVAGRLRMPANATAGVHRLGPAAQAPLIELYRAARFSYAVAWRCFPIAARMHGCGCGGADDSPPTTRRSGSSLIRLIVPSPRRAGSEPTSRRPTACAAAWVITRASCREASCCRRSASRCCVRLAVEPARSTVAACSSHNQLGHPGPCLDHWTGDRPPTEILVFDDDSTTALTLVGFRSHQCRTSVCPQTAATNLPRPNIGIAADETHLSLPDSDARADLIGERHPRPRSSP